ncbi:nose resistant to fluoxetine protein 6-like [Asterias rubens]|uniref:nose resistant to fluoxetine protein 6-like n=1 Tax=Asterias rubens TaxID=7604 RepID=UPI001454E8A8|nr:nose resistant to fluoxetine protein 6-like [Asterias rubens]
METQRGLLLLLGFALFLATVHATDDKNADQMPLLKSLYKSRSPALLPAALRADNETISPACSAELKRLFSGDIHTLGTDAVMALDAFGKPAAGFLQMNWAWLGHYDECMAIEGFNFCLVQMSLNATMLLHHNNKSSSVTANSAAGAFNQIAIRWGICPPTNCSEYDIHVVLKDILDAMKVLDGIITTEALQEDYAVCTKNPPIPYSAGFICAVTFCCLIATLMVTGALYDEYLQWQARTPSRQRLISKRDFSRPWRILNDDDDEDDDELLINDAGTVIQDVQTQSKQSLAARLLLCFAFNRNLSKLMDTKQGDASVGSINGIRVISMFWVMLGHTVIFGFSTQITDNTVALFAWLQTHFGFQAVANAFYSVDSFFFLSGFLLSYLTFPRFEELKTVKRWALFYFHRYWRLTPLFAFTILIYMYIPQFFGEGPIWQVGTQRPFCPKYWWSSLLYISNFWPTSFGSECIAWTWYLANDMQFFIISPLLMAPLYYYPVFGWLSLIATLLASMITSGWIVAENDFTLNLLGLLLPVDGKSYTDYVYGKPYCRIAPYLVGIGLGYIMYRTGKRKVKMSPFLALLGWLAAAGMGIGVVYGLYPSYKTPMTKTATVIYAAVSRFVWAVALAWVVYACKYGYGGWINKFLSWSLWVPLGRITFAAYMVHPIVIENFYSNFATTYHFSVYLTAFYFAGVVSVSYFVALFFALAIEYPFANLEKLILPTPKKRTKTLKGSDAAKENGIVTTMVVNGDQQVVTNSPSDKNIAINCN